MYYKFSGFTQKLTGAWASDAYSPQVRVAPRRFGQEKGRPEFLLLVVLALEPGEASACCSFSSPRASSHPLAAAVEVPSSAGAPPATLAGCEAGPGT